MGALLWPPTMQDFNRKLDGRALMRIAYLGAPGTWGAPFIGFQADIGRLLDKNIFHDLNVDYAMSFGPVNGPINALSYDESRRGGTERLIAMSSDLDCLQVWGGYSQGADVVYNAAKELRPGGRLEHRMDQVLTIVTCGHPCRFDGTINVGHKPPGGGIVRSPKQSLVLPAAAGRWIDFALDKDMYATADPDHDYLWIGYAALTKLQLHSLGDLASAMLQLITRDEFADALAELLPIDFPGLSKVISELTGVDGDRLLENRTATSGGLLDALQNGASTIGGLTGGLLPSVPGSGSKGTESGWLKMARTFTKLIDFATSHDHENYWAPHRAVFDGKTAVQWAADYLNYRGGQLL